MALAAAAAAAARALLQMVADHRSPDLVILMGSTAADLDPPAGCADLNLVMGVIDRRENFDDQTDFSEKLHIKFQNFYPMGLPLARLSSPHSQKIVKRVPERVSAGHRFDEVIHCLCTASRYMYEYMDFGGISCLSCAKHLEIQPVPPVQANGQIKEGFMLSWREIEQIWKNHLRVSLHSADCFLNSKYLEWSGSYFNIVEDMNHCMIHMGGDFCVQGLIKLQIEKYQTIQKLQIEKHWTRQKISGESTRLKMQPYLEELQKRGLILVAASC